MSPENSFRASRLHADLAQISPGYKTRIGRLVSQTGTILTRHLRRGRIAGAEILAEVSDLA